MRKEDMLMESGEYFITQDEKAREKKKTKLE